VLRKICGPERGEVLGKMRKKIHNKELYNLYPSPDTLKVIKSETMRWAGHVALMGQMRNAYNILVGKPKGKRPTTWKT